MGWLLRYWQEIIVVATIVGIFTRVNYSFRRNTEKHEEAKKELDEKLKHLATIFNNRVGGHEDLCSERYKNINDNISTISAELKSQYSIQDKKISDIHEKINKVSNDVAYQSALIKQSSSQ